MIAFETGRARRSRRSLTLEIGGRPFLKKGSFPYDRKSYRRFPKRRKDAAIRETFDEPPFQKTLIAPQLNEMVIRTE